MKRPLTNTCLRMVGALSKKGLNFRWLFAFFLVDFVLHCKSDILTPFAFSLVITFHCFLTGLSLKNVSNELIHMCNCFT